MGIHIAKTNMLDEIDYEPGPPNLWRLRKHLAAPANGTGSTQQLRHGELARERTTCPTTSFHAATGNEVPRSPIRGSLDINTAPALGEEIDRLVATKPTKVVGQPLGGFLDLDRG